MDVVLRQDVERLGAKGQRVRVKDGFARNFLLPRGLALPSTDAVLARMAVEQQALDARLGKERAFAHQRHDALSQKSITITVAAGPDDKLFGAVTKAHIAVALKQEGVEIDKRKLELAEPIAALGVYHVPAHLHPYVTATVNVWVVKQ